MQRKRSIVAAFSEAIEEIAPQIANSLAEWENAYGQPYPKSDEDWVRLLVQTGMSPDAVLNCRYSPEHAVAIVEGYLQRLCDQRKQMANPSDTPVSDPQADIAQVAGQPPTHRRITYGAKMLEAVQDDPTPVRVDGGTMGKLSRMCPFYGCRHQDTRVAFSTLPRSGARKTCRKQAYKKNLDGKIDRRRLPKRKARLYSLDD